MPQISRQRALTLVANSRDGHTETILRARGCTRQVLGALIRDGLATASAGRTDDLIRIKITEAGRAALRKLHGPSSSSASEGTGGASSTGSPPSILSMSHSVDKTNGNADGRFEGERRKLATEIMTLSPPPPGCAQRARLVLESRFTFNELQALIEALRVGIESVLKPDDDNAPS